MFMLSHFPSKVMKEGFLMEVSIAAADLNNDCWNLSNFTEIF